MKQTSPKSPEKTLKFSDVIETSVIHSQFERNLTRPRQDDLPNRRRPSIPASPDQLALLSDDVESYGTIDRNSTESDLENMQETTKRDAFKRSLIYSFGLLTLVGLSAIVVSRLQSLDQFTLQSHKQPELGKFLHITDLHLDPLYKPGGLGSYWCHRDYYIPPKDLSVKAKDDLRQAPDWGLPVSSCDSPPNLVQGTLEYISENLVLDFVVYTGDGARHENDYAIPRPLSEIYDLNRKLTPLFVKNFESRGVPVIPSLGNNDVFPHQSVNFSLTESIEILDTYATDIWSSFIPVDQVDSFKRFGSFARMVVPEKLAVISLNTLYFFQQNEGANVGNCVSAKHHSLEESKHKEWKAGDYLFEWLEQTLKYYRKHGIHAYLIGHIAPSKFLYYEGCFHRYAELAVKYSDVILYHGFGHQNVDLFFFLNKHGEETQDLYANDDQDWVKVMSGLQWCNGVNPFVPPPTDHSDVSVKKSMVPLFDYLLGQYSMLSLPKRKKDKLPYAVIHVAPSIIPTYYPSFRYVDYDKQNKVGALQDWTQYYLNLTEWNVEPKEKLEYQVEYTLRQAYLSGMRQEIDTVDWMKLAKRISKEEKLKKRYAQYMIVSSEAEKLVDK